MPEGSYLYCDVSLPVPLDQPFTYSLPETLRHRVRAGSRLIVPFGTRKLTGVILRCHDDPPAVATRDALRLIDSEPVLSAELMALGRWIAGYYCSPLGDVLRGMLPLSSEIRRGKIWTLTDAGRDAARQLLLDSSPDDPVLQILRMLEKRPLSAAYLAKAMPLADKAIRALERKRFIVAEEVQVERDPLRAPSDRLRVELAAARKGPEPKFNKPERELRAFLELHPGSHNLKELEDMVKHASAAARSLARKGMVSLKPETVAMKAAIRARHELNPAQQAAFQQIHEAIQAKRFQTFLLHGVTGSGKTEVYLTAIETALAEGRSALLLVPEIALTPQMAGQFFSRFGDRVAILHSRLHRRGAHRAVAPHPLRRGQRRGGDALRRVRAGAEPGPDRGGRRARRQLQAGGESALQRPRRGHRARAGAPGRAWCSARPRPAWRAATTRRRASTRCWNCRGASKRGPCRSVELIDMRQEFLETRKQETFSRKLIEALGQRVESGEQTIVLLNRRGFSSFVACRACGERVQCINCSLTLTYHKRDRRLLCHYCGYAEKVPSQCPKCAERAHLLSGHRQRARGRGAAPRVSRPRASRGSTATRSPASASTRPSCRISAKAITTCWWARR